MTKAMTAVFVLILLVGCATEQQLRYQADARQNSFETYFARPAEVRTFLTIEEAEDYIQTAQIKLQSSIDKSSVQGLSAKLTGPVVTDPHPVLVAHFFGASNRNSSLDLENSKAKLEKNLLEAVSVTSVFLVFYDDRAVSISDFYLDRKYRYSSNAQIPSFHFLDHDYRAVYPVAWGTTQAFQYLKKVIE